jgi:acyl-CoA thioester hydrolase
MKQFSLEIPLRWGDMDAMQHLNNVQYFRLMEEARVQWFAKFEFSTLPTGEAPILAHTSVDFVRAMTYPATAVVKQTTTRVGRSSLDMQIQIETKSEPGLVYANGKAVIVWYDYRANKSVPWPETVRRRLVD